MEEDLKLRPYQIEDAEWLTDHPKSILGHQMRVGKTIETIELVHKLDLENILVICPKSVIPVWPYEAERWYGKEFADRFVVFNYEKLLNPSLVSALLEQHWDLVVYDECHKLKNPKAKRTKAATLVASHSPRLILASGTPQQNGPQDLFSLFHMIDPITFGHYTSFISRFCIIQQLPKPPFPRIIVGAKNKEQLNEMLHTYMLRRRLEEVRDHLPPIIPETIPVELDESQREKYKEMEDEMFVMLDNGEKINSPNILSQRLRLRQICLEPNLLSPTNKISSPSTKTNLIVELLQDRGEDEGKTLVFTYFEKYARILQQAIVKSGVECGIYTGQESSDSRIDLQKRFQGDARLRAIVGTIGAMGLGLNLTAADLIIFPDWWFNPAVNEQAIYRTQGEGQTRSVHVVDLWCKGTIEDAVHRVLSRKERMFKDIVEADTAAIDELRKMRKESRNG